MRIGTAHPPGEPAGRVASTPAIRVVVAEDAGLIRDMLCRTLTEAGLIVTGAAGSADEAVILVDAAPPDIVLLDIRMPPTFTDDGLRAALRIRAAHPDIAVLLLSSYGEVEYATRLVESLPGRVGYLSKERTASAAELIDAVNRVVSGGVVIDPDLVTLLLRQRRADNPLDRLTDRELETLALMAEGRSNQAIAARMAIAVSTVEKHVTAVFRKLTLVWPDGEPSGGDNARVRAVLTYLRHREMFPTADRPPAPRQAEIG